LPKLISPLAAQFTKLVHTYIRKRGLNFIYNHDDPPRRKNIILLFLLLDCRDSTNGRSRIVLLLGRPSSQSPHRWRWVFPARHTIFPS